MKKNAKWKHLLKIKLKLKSCKNIIYSWFEEKKKGEGSI